MSVREASCRVIGLLCAMREKHPEQLDDHCDDGETREQCFDRLLRINRISPFTALTLIGG